MNIFYFILFLEILEFLYFLANNALHNRGLLLKLKHGRKIMIM